ncbi:MAG TPA: glycosyltransferase, partial [Candidatus Nanopelagicales bacterium]
MTGADGSGESAEADRRADEALDRFLPAARAALARRHHVAAIVVAHMGAPWLPRTLRDLAAQVRPPDAVVGVDAGSVDDSEALLRAALPTVLSVPVDAGLAGALAVGVAAAGAADSAARAPAQAQLLAEARAEDPIQWYWLLHDDSAPEPAALAALLEGADRHPGAHVLVPKTVAWSDPGRLVGVGNRWAPGVPVVERLEPRERDQGQYDVDRAVHSGSSAGMLVRADAWARLGGMDPRYGQWAGAVDLCRRVWGTGASVVFVPQAVVAHRQAGHRGVRPGADQSPPHRRARAGQLLLDLTQASGWALPWRWLRGWLSSLGRALAMLLTREPEEATAEVRGAWDVLAHPGQVRAGRRALRLAELPASTRPPQVRAARGTVLLHAMDELAGSRGPRRPRRSWRQWSGWLPLAIAAALALVTFLRDPGQLLGSGTLRGGGLLPAPEAGTLLRSYLATWQEARFGLPSGQPATLPLLAAASVPLLGSVDLLLRLLVGLAVPLAFLSAYLALGPHRVGRQRIPLALAWSLLPAASAASAGGRLSTLAVALLGPPTARLLVGAVAQPELGAGRAPRLRPAIAAGTTLGVLMAFAPLTGLLALAAGLVAWLLAGLPRRPIRAGLIILATSAVFVALWSPSVVRAPWQLFTDLGRDDPSLGTPAAWPWGLAPGGPTSVAWAGAPLLVLAVVAVVLVGPTRRLLLAVAGGVVLLVAAAWYGPLAASPWLGVAPQRLWPGQLLLLSAGLFALALARAVDRSGARRRQHLTRHRLLVAGWAGAIGALALGWWLTPVLATVGTGTGLPAVVSLAEQTPERPRALVLARGEADEVRYGVASGPGARLGDAEALAPHPDDRFTDVVAGLVVGAGPDLEAELGGRGLRYVVFDGPQADPLVARLDAAVGLRRLASSAQQSLWLVSGQPVRAELVSDTAGGTAAGTAAGTAGGTPGGAAGGAAAEQAAGDVTVPITTWPTSVDVVLHPQLPLPRWLRLAETADPGWRGTLAGAPVALGA